MKKKKKYLYKKYPLRRIIKIILKILIIKKVILKWDNYVEKKEELVKEKQLLVTFENFETSIQNDELKK